MTYQHKMARQSRTRELGRKVSGLAGSLILLAGVVGMTGTAWAQTSAEDTAAKVAERLVIRSPEAGIPLFGPVVFEVEDPAASNPSATTATPVSVRLVVDGAEVGSFDAPPYRANVNVGDDNQEHLFEVVVVTATGEEARRSLRSPSIHIDEEIDLGLQQLYASIQLRDGSPATTLEASDLALTDDGQRQQIVTFEGGDAPMTLVLLIDGSISMGGRPIETAMRGARTVLTGLRPLDEVKVVLFTDRILAMSDFVPGDGELPSVLDQVRPGGGSAVNDHLYMALQLLESRQGRRVVLILSDGGDNHSALSSAQVREVARRSQAVIYWVHPGGILAGDGSVGQGPIIVGEPRSVWRDRDDARTERTGLAKIVQLSGGREVSLRRGTSVEKAFDEILAELRAQVAVGYYPEPAYDDGRWREVQLEVVGQRGAKVRSRGGYFDF